jgi:uncharacterized phage protein (TIGR01671 family)
MISPYYIKRNGVAYWKEDSVTCTSEDIMQYTGLKDKNDVEIYEGDICELLTPYGELDNSQWEEKIERDVMVVTFANGCFMFDEVMPLHRVCLDCIEILGNIHENSDMLP